MGFGDFFKGVAGAVGGAAKGYAAAAPTVMGMQQEQGQFDTQQADLAAYRAATLAQDKEQADRAFAETQTQNRWSRAFDRREAQIQRIRADAERIRAEADLTRANQASRTAATASNQESIDARIRRAERMIAAATPEMGQAELDHVAKLHGFTSYGQGLAVQGAASGQQYGPMAGGYSPLPTTPSLPTGQGSTPGVPQLGGDAELLRQLLSEP